MQAITHMHNFVRAAAGASVLVLLFLSGGATHAQTQRSGGDTARVVQQLQQLTAEKAKLQSDLDAANKELEALKAGSAQAAAEQARLQQRARELEQAGEKLRIEGSGNDEALQKSRAQLQELIGKYREMAQALRDVETERDSLKAGKSVQERELKACVDRNAQMYLLTDEILGRLEDQGLWSTLTGKEPFTRLSRTRLENLVEDYRYRVDELKLVNKSVATTPQQ